MAHIDRKYKQHHLRRVSESSSPDNMKVDKNINSKISMYFQKLDMEQSGKELKSVDRPEAEVGNGSQGDGECLPLIISSKFKEDS